MAQRCSQWPGSRVQKMSDQLPERPELQHFNAFSQVGYVNEDGLFVGARRYGSATLYRGAVWSGADVAEAAGNPLEICTHDHRTAMAAIECAEASLE